jgi:hypothetical protein
MTADHTDESADEKRELIAGIEETLTWLTFHSGYTAGWKAAGGDVGDLDVLRGVTLAAHHAYRAYVAEQEQRRGE